MFLLGGYVSLMALAQRPDVFKVNISITVLLLCKLFINTERGLKMQQKFPAAYHHHHHTRSDHWRPAIVIVRQNCLSSASSRASVTVTPMSQQIWWIQVVGGRLLACLQSCEGRSPSLILVQIRRIWFAGASLWSLYQFSVQKLWIGQLYMDRRIMSALAGYISTRCQHIIPCYANVMS